MNPEPLARNAGLAILGAGPIGMACALLLARRGFECELVDARSLEQACRDRRLLALSAGSVELLRGLLGDSMIPLAPIREVHVSSAGEFGLARLSSRDFAGRDLGATAWHSDLVQCLARAAQRETRIRIRRPCRVLGLEQSSAEVCVLLEGGQSLPAALAINAEGAPSTAAASAATAVLANLQIEGPPRAAAFERFTRLGPLALLPYPAGAGPDPESWAGGPERRSMVWCLERNLASEWVTLGDEAFLDGVQAMIGRRIGRVVRIGPRSTFPLTPQWRRRLREHRVVYVGNAAQTLHPVAGQGLNLGLRDCACLADCLSAASVDPIAALGRYVAARRADRLAVWSLTSALPRIFGPSSGPLAATRSIALLALDLVPPVRRNFASLLMYGLRN